MNFVDVFDILCVSKGVSKSKVLSAVGLSVSALHRWNEGAPNAGTLKKIADYFEMSPAEIYRMWKEEDYATLYKMSKKEQLGAEEAEEPKVQPISATPAGSLAVSIERADLINHVLRISEENVKLLLAVAQQMK